MSRCFPYPPPGYTLSSADNEALIESIKLQEERVKSKKEHKVRDKSKDKEQRKKEKKEKKEKKKEKKEKAVQNAQKSESFLGNFGEKSCTDSKSELLVKRCKLELELLEQSVLTEEHGHPLCANTPCSSSESTETSNKRKRQCSPDDVNRTHGKIIRIKLSKKPYESSFPANEQQPCSTSVRGVTQVPPQNKVDFGLAHRGQGLCSTSNGPCEVGQTIDCAKAHPTSLQIKRIAPGEIEIPPVNKTIMTPMQKLEMHLDNLLENLAVPSLHGVSLPDDDSDWLFQSKSSNKYTEKKQIRENASVTCSSGSQTCWPRAQYLQGVDVYALPFTVPL